RVGFPRKIREAILDGGIYDRVAVELVRDRLVVSSEEVLIDPVVVVEQLKCRFKPLCKTVESIAVQTFVVHSADLKDYAEISCFGQENMGIDKPVQVHLLVE